MYIYNVTISVEDAIHDKWLAWIKEHIPQVLATGKFTEAKLTKVLSPEGSEENTYSVQYRAKSRQDLDGYYKDNAHKFRAEGVSLFGDKMLAFRTELEIIDEYTVTIN